METDTMGDILAVLDLNSIHAIQIQETLVVGFGYTTAQCETPCNRYYILGI